MVPGCGSVIAGSGVGPRTPRVAQPCAPSGVDGEGDLGAGASRAIGRGESSTLCVGNVHGDGSADDFWGDGLGGCERAEGTGEHSLPSGWGSPSQHDICRVGTGEGSTRRPGIYGRGKHDGGAIWSEELGQSRDRHPAASPRRRCSHRIGGGEYDRQLCGSMVGVCPVGVARGLCLPSREYLRQHDRIPGQVRILGQGLSERG